MIPSAYSIKLKDPGRIGVDYINLNRNSIKMWKKMENIHNSLKE